MPFSTEAMARRAALEIPAGPRDVHVAGRFVHRSIEVREPEDAFEHKTLRKRGA